MLRFVVLLGLATATLSAPAQSDTRISLVKRKFKDNSEWTVTTNIGPGRLLNVFSEGNEWSLELPKGKKYKITQVFSGDPTEWRISDGKAELFFSVSFSKDYNEWRTGDEGKWIYVKTIFKNDFSKWTTDSGANDFSMTASFSDGSEWKVKDSVQGESEMTRASMIFIPLASYIFGRKK